MPIDVESVLALEQVGADVRALRLGSISGVNAQTGTSYTLVLSDAGKLVTLANAAEVDLTIPTNAAAAFPLYTMITLGRFGAGAVEVIPDTGVTLNSEAGNRRIAAQYAAATLLKTGNNTWWLVGRLAA